MEPSAPEQQQQRATAVGYGQRTKDSATFEYRTVRIQQNCQQQVIYSSSSSSSSTSASSSSTVHRSTRAGESALGSSAAASRLMLTMGRPNHQLPPGLSLFGCAGGANYQRCKL
uniref:Uncharacterized protein n=1 Tax=Anopheles quadriannulatus TaxID=34691 RepID=A0A182WTM4_ANOQN